MAIGLDAMRRGAVVGTPMSGLAGAVDDFKLPCSGIVIALPTARLLHLNGTPRERWVPPVLVDLVANERRGTMEAGSRDSRRQRDDEDPTLGCAQEILEELISRTGTPSSLDVARARLACSR